jgi:Na+-exporting ATPase
VLDLCDNIALEDTTKPLSDHDKQAIIANMEALASQGLRVLALAQQPLANTLAESESEVRSFLQSAPRETLEQGLIFQGLIGIYDPPRVESRPSVLACQQAGITVHMLTGDHPKTARAIASQVAILPPLERLQQMAPSAVDAMVMAAHDFDRLSDEQIDALQELPLVVARCAPGTKVRMIKALHRRRCFVAMTGDGVNDSPSLKAADIGIAMGTGSDVAKESSDIILTDDNFASILNAIEEGRRTFDNIQKFMLHVLVANIAFVVSLLVGLAFKDRDGISVFIVSPVQVMWMLMGIGAFCETGLGFETAVPGILKRPPQNACHSRFRFSHRVRLANAHVAVKIRHLHPRILRRHGLLWSHYDGMRPRLLRCCHVRF